MEVSPTAEPPVCRIMDFGKFLFEQNKKAHAAKRKQKQIQVKEVKFRPGTEEADYQVKLRNLIRFLTEGDKAKVTLRFRGREMAHRRSGAGSSTASWSTCRARHGRAERADGRAADDDGDRSQEEVTGGLAADTPPARASGVKRSEKERHAQVEDQPGAAKRFRKTAKGFKRGQANRRHILTRDQEA